MKLILATALALVGSSSAAVTSLSTANYSELTAGKIVFIKFFAPWCGHCKAMAGDWEALASKYAGSNEVLIAEADCTAEGDDLCKENDVQGFPTLKYGDPLALEDYQGGRGLDELEDFASENLKPTCSPANIDLCDGEQKAKIQEIAALSDAEIDAAIAAVDKIIADADTAMEKGIEGLQATYEKMMAENEATKKSAKADSDYKILKAVKAVKKSGSDEL